MELQHYVVLHFNPEEDMMRNLFIYMSMSLILACGSVGEMGPEGEEGPIGTEGASGSDGDDGNPGAAGAAGAAGPSGPTGLTGVGGDDGNDGNDGTPGTDGDDGANGLACWDVNGDAVCDPGEDTTGDGTCDRDDCATGIQGDQGDTGAQGDQGLQGIAGNDGAAGDDGDDGAQGDRGAGVHWEDVNGVAVPIITVQGAIMHMTEAGALYTVHPLTGSVSVRKTGHSSVEQYGSDDCTGTAYVDVPINNILADEVFQATYATVTAYFAVDGTIPLTAQGSVPNFCSYRLLNGACFPLADCQSPAGIHREPLDNLRVEAAPDTINLGITAPLHVVPVI